MGIAYCLIRTSVQNVEAIRGRPKAVAEFIYQDPDMYEEPKIGFFAGLFGRPRSAHEQPVPERTDGDETDLDKAWHVVHYLLSGTPGRGDGPLALIGDDLHPLADLDFGLGKPNVISAEMVRAFNEAASVMTDEEFLARYVPSEMPLEELYMGDVIARGDVNDIREYALENFQILKAFVQQATESGEAIITYYT